MGWREALGLGSAGGQLGGFQTSSFGLTFEHVRNANSEAHSDLLTQLLWVWGSGMCIVTALFWGQGGVGELRGDVTNKLGALGTALPLNLTSNPGTRGFLPRL